jgi:hypothetical protein
MSNPADTLTNTVAGLNAGTVPNTPDGVLWHEFAVARAIASAADKRKRAADKAVQSLVAKTIGTSTVYDSPHLTVTSKTVETRGTLNEDALRVAMHKAGIASNRIEDILADGRNTGSTQTTYTVVFR